MAVKVCGMKCRLELLVLVALLCLYIGSTLMCNCTRIEPFAPAQSSYAMGGGESAYEFDLKKATGGHQGTPVPLAPGQLDFFADNKFKPECCPSTYSSGGGCACMSAEQVSYLNQRGSNNSCRSGCGGDSI